jgi:hypothetical protein
MEKLVRLMIKNRMLKPQISAHFGIEKKNYSRNDAVTKLSKFKKFFNIKCDHFSDDDTPPIARARAPKISEKKYAELKSLFDAYDHNRNDTLEAAELMGAFGNVFENESDCAALVEKFDVNGDGKLNFEEFCEFMT